MFCPSCKAEYRPGFARCSDCDIPLVAELPNEPVPDADSLRVVWEGEDQSTCVSLCRKLMSSDIPYEVAQIPKSRSQRMAVDWYYSIGVPASIYEKAKEIVVIEEGPEEADDDAESVLAEAPSLDAPSHQKRPGADSYLESWYPEDAIVEVWRQSSTDTGTVVALSLNENLIRFRSEVCGDGSRALFVLPEDESRAREIVREIREGIPPQ
jgi:hypothetical protein